jgi:hypothetical protein
MHKNYGFGKNLLVYTAINRAEWIRDLKYKLNLIICYNNLFEKFDLLLDCSQRFYLMHWWIVHFLLFLFKQE